MSPSPPASNVAKQRMMAASCLAAKTAVSAGGRVRGKYVLRSRAAGATRTAIQAPEAVLLLQSLGELRGDEVAAAKGASQDHHALLRNWEGPVPRAARVLGVQRGEHLEESRGSSPTLFHGVLPRCTWMLVCRTRASRTMANWPTVCSGGSRDVETSRNDG